MCRAGTVRAHRWGRSPWCSSAASRSSPASRRTGTWFRRTSHRTDSPRRTSCRGPRTPESNDAPVKSASRRSCADRHEPGPNCTPWKLAARALLPLPVAAPNTLLAHWVLLKSAGGRGDTIEHGDFEHRSRELRVGQIDALQRHLVEARRRGRSRPSTGPGLCRWAGRSHTPGSPW